MDGLHHVTTREAIWRETYEPSGARVWQLTSAPAIHANIYMDVPYADAQSRYAMALKSATSYGSVDVWRLDLQAGDMVLAAADVFRWEGLTTSPDQRFFFCARRPAPELLEVRRIEIGTLDTTTFQLPCSARLLGCCATCAPGNDLLVMPAFLGPHRFGLLRFDLASGTCAVCHEGGDELCNSNPLLDPGGTGWMLVQRNRGAQCDDEGRCLVSTGPEGATMDLVQVADGAERPLPVGLPHTGACGGHSSWLGATGAFVTNVSWASEDETRARGSLAVVHAASGEVRLTGQGLCAVHVHAARDGRTFVADSWAGNWGDKCLYLGSFHTGRSRALCEHGSSFGAPQYTHPHAWLTPDNRWVVFNSDRTGVPHVYAASVPDSLLAEIEA
jgi:hypothetical protein